MSITLAHAAKNTYVDPDLKTPTVKLLPGEYHVAKTGEVIVTTLGSCIAACIRDKEKGIGGMNHFMLPTSEEGTWAGVSAASRYGNFAMEYLINEIIKRGGVKSKMEAKIFGGGIMFGAGNGSHVGATNIDFAKRYLTTEKIPMTAEDVGSNVSRKVYFEPASGKVIVKRLVVLKNDTLLQRETAYSKQLATQPIAGDVELF